jgi:hypothetical protein
MDTHAIAVALLPRASPDDSFERVLAVALDTSAGLPLKSDSRLKWLARYHIALPL